MRGSARDGEQLTGRFPRMKVLYVGPLWVGGTCRQRQEALVDLGQDVVALDTYPYLYSGNRLAVALRSRTEWGGRIGRLNAHFVELVWSARPTVVFVDHVPFLRRESLVAARRVGRAVFVHRNNDDPFAAGALRWRVFKAAIAYYDLHFVPRDENLVEYERLGAPLVRRMYPSFNLRVHRPVVVDRETRERLGGDVGFIGAWECEREKTIRFLGESGVGVRIWGPNWGGRLGGLRDVQVEGRSLFGEEYVRAVCSFSICLGFLRKVNRDASTSRSVEIPACGTLLVAERTPEHEALFVEGLEAEFFGSSEELLEKLRRYLGDADARRRVAAAGRDRCLNSGYDNVSRMGEMLAEAVNLAESMGVALEGRRLQ